MPRSRRSPLRAAALLAATLALPLRAQSLAPPAPATSRAGTSPSGPTAAGARAFLDSAEAQLAASSTKANRAHWVAATFITDDTALLAARGYDQRRMMKTAEGFFTSLGFAPLPATFWERSMIVKPRDREVVCHASAWDVDNKTDVRIKMCAEVAGDEFVTMRHELGHNFRVGLLAPGEAPSAAADTAALLRQALDKVAFLPFGLLIDQWRWQVFSGEVAPADYNRAWWALRAKYQGVAPPVARTEADFDPGGAPVGTR